MTTVNARSTSSAFLTDEQLALQAQARQYATEELLPIANRVDRQKIDIPAEVLDRIAELGYFGLRIGVEYGGLGLGVLEYCLVAEELARAWMSAASIIGRANGTGCEVADQDRRAELLRRSASGGWIGAVAFSEPKAGSDLGSVSCQATRDGDEWVISGEKRWCGNALAGDFILLLARTADTDPEQRWRGLESFLIEKPRGTFPDGLSGYVIDKIGYHGMTSWHLQFDGLRLPASAMLPGQHGGEGEAFRDTVNRLNVARVHTAARAVGLARGGLEDALAYAQSRNQFGKPLVGFQVVRHKLAEMATQVEAGRQLYYHAARLMDSGVDARRDVAMAKLFASEMAERVTSEALQVLGGNGYTTEYAVERHWRDARLTKIFEGTSDIQREIISRSLIGGRS
jgi:alkylation response protein AidB-like acyl-CoA dehydrogenase